MDKAQMKKGVLELCILHICSEQDRYGYEIMKLVTDASYTPVRAKETPDLAVGGDIAFFAVGFVRSQIHAPQAMLFGLRQRRIGKHEIPALCQRIAS